jgi:hypothetical protein
MRNSHECEIVFPHCAQQCIQGSFQGKQSVFLMSFSTFEILKRVASFASGFKMPAWCFGMTH